MRLFIFIFSVIFALSGPSYAEQPGRYASIVVDADTLEVIHARQIDEPRFPASLTKVMTLYLTFDALNAGTLQLKEKMTVSRNAARTAPVDIGLRTGQTITVEQAIQALSVKSANDAAVVLAEHIGGSEETFAAMMTVKAQELRMMRTTFKTASGLPHPQQTTTARDMAKLASATLTNHKRYYHYFGQTHFTFRGMRYKNTNSLLHWLAGVDGFKTGYTNASGFNLIISSKRENRRIIAVVLGGATGESRNQHMQDLIERSFKTLGVQPVKSHAPVIVKQKPEPEKIKPKLASYTSAVRLRGRDSSPVTVITSGKTSDIKIAKKGYDQKWSIQVGAFTNKQAAEDQVEVLSVLAENGLSPDNAQITPLQRNGLTLFRARFTDLNVKEAEEACRMLSHLASGCLVIAPTTG